MMVFDTPLRRMPSMPLPSAWVPAALRPIRFPWIVFPFADGLHGDAVPVLPEMTLPSPAAVPPIVLLVALL